MAGLSRLVAKNPPADDREDFAIRVEEARAEIQAAIDRAELRDDPLRHPLSAISTVLELLSGIVTKLDAVQPPPGQDVVDAIDRAVSKIALRIGSDVRRRTLVTVAAALAIVGFGGIGVGYLAGYRHGAADMAATVTDLRAALAEGVEGARIWRNLILWNSRNVLESYRQCQPAQSQEGRTGCLFPFWTSPVPVPVPVP